jgi:hypothetical protein
VSTRAKIIVTIGVLFAVLLLFLTPSAIRLCAKRFIPTGTGTTVAEATRLVTEVHGVEKINKDAEAVFNQYGTSGFENWKTVKERDFPVISNLVSSFGYYSIVDVIPEGTRGMQPAPGFPAQIEIRFGSHTHPHFLYIVDWRKPFDLTSVTNREPRWSQIVSNIFVE